MLNVARDVRNFFESDAPSAETQPLVYNHIALADEVGAAIEEHFDSTAQWLDEHLSAGRNVLVHCIKGRSRSAAMIVNYLMTKATLHLTDAMRVLDEARPTASINDGFMLKLQRREEALFPDVVAQRREQQLASATADKASAFQSEAKQKIDAQKAPKRRSLKQIAKNKKKVAELEQKMQEQAAQLAAVERRSSRRTRSAVSYVGLDDDEDGENERGNVKRAATKPTAPVKRHKSMFVNAKPAFFAATPAKTTEQQPPTNDDDDNEDEIESLNDEPPTNDDNTGAAPESIDDVSSESENVIVDDEIVASQTSDPKAMSVEDWVAMNVV